MFFLKNLPQNFITIKQDIEIQKKSSNDNSSINKLKNLQGVGKELYKDIDSDEYIEKLRNEW